MPKPAALGAALALGARAAAGREAVAGSAERRLASTDRLREGLQQLGLKLVSADLGRTPAGLAWVLSVELPDQCVVSSYVQLAAQENPHCVEACDSVVRKMAERAGITRVG